MKGPTFFCFFRSYVFHCWQTIEWHHKLNLKKWPRCFNLHPQPNQGCILFKIKPNLKLQVQMTLTKIIWCVIRYEKLKQFLFLSPSWVSADPHVGQSARVWKYLWWVAFKVWWLPKRRAGSQLAFQNGLLSSSIKSAVLIPPWRSS